MSPNVNGASVPSLQGQQLLTFRMGDLPAARAVFLSNWSGLRVHHKTKAGTPCWGEGKCDQCKGHVKLVWKGYAAARIYDPATDHWRLWVVELLQVLAEDLRDSRPLRGAIVDITRAELNGGRYEFRGQVKGRAPECELDPPFDCRPAVERMYGFGSLDWGAEPIFAPRVYAVVKKLSVPGHDDLREEARMAREEREAEVKRANEQLRQARLRNLR